MQDTGHKILESILNVWRILAIENDCNGSSDGHHTIWSVLGIGETSTKHLLHNVQVLILLAPKDRGKHAVNVSGGLVDLYIYIICLCDGIEMNREFGYLWGNRC